MLVLDRHTQSVAVNGVEVVATRTEWNLLAYMGQDPLKFYSSDDLLSGVWGDYSSSDPKYFISKLRDKGVAIENRRGFGYRLGPDARVIGDLMTDDRAEPECSGHRLCDGTTVYCARKEKRDDKVPDRSLDSRLGFSTHD